MTRDGWTWFLMGALACSAVNCLNWAWSLIRVRNLREHERAVISHLALRVTTLRYYLNLIAERRATQPDALAREALEDDMRSMVATP